MKANLFDGLAHSGNSSRNLATSSKNYFQSCNDDGIPSNWRQYYFIVCSWFIHSPDAGDDKRRRCATTPLDRKSGNV